MDQLNDIRDRTKKTQAKASIVTAVCWILFVLSFIALIVNVYVGQFFSVGLNLATIGLLAATIRIWKRNSSKAETIIEDIDSLSS
jgi:hypothetical protein